MTVTKTKSLKVARPYAWQKAPNLKVCIATTLPELMEIRPTLVSQVSCCPGLACNEAIVFSQTKYVRMIHTLRKTTLLSSCNSKIYATCARHKCAFQKNRKQLQIWSLPATLASPSFNGFSKKSVSECTRPVVPKRRLFCSNIPKIGLASLAISMPRPASSQHRLFHVIIFIVILDLRSLSHQKMMKAGYIHCH